MNSLWIESTRPAAFVRDRTAPVHRPARPSRAALSVLALACCAVLITHAHAQSAPPAYGADASAQVASAAQAPASQSTDQLQQLAAPIALDPDPLVAQILAAATYPAQVVEAWRWMQRHPGLQGQQLIDAVNARAWDPSVKALTQFPAVLDNMNQNLSWTSALGDAYVNQQDALMDAIQVLRQRAQAAGGLQSTSQQVVQTDGQTIAIEPTDPEVVYVPEYDPWLVYGDPLAAYPGWLGVPGLYDDGPGIYFGAGLGIGLLAGVGWGWHHWGFDWHARRALFDRAPFIFHGGAFAHRGDFVHAVPRIDRIGAFHGGVARGFVTGGRPRLGGGFPAGGFHGGAFHGGGFPGGGFHGGGFAGGGFHGGGGHGGGGGGHR